MTIGLTGPLRIESTPDGEHFRLIAPFRVKLDSGKVVEVPKGFVTDFASYWRPLGKYSEASVVHDYLYSRADWARDEADAVFLSLMKRSGVGIVRRRVMFWGVRLFGGMFRYNKESICR